MQTTIHKTPDRVLTKPIADIHEPPATDDLALQIEVVAVLISELQRKAAKRSKVQLNAARAAESNAKSGAKALGRLAEVWRKLEQDWEELIRADISEQQQADLAEVTRKLPIAQNAVNDARQRLAQYLQQWIEADPSHITRARVRKYIGLLDTAGAWEWED